MAKMSSALDGMTRVADAMEEKFNELLERSGHTMEEVESFQKEKEESEAGEGSTEGEGTPSETAAQGDENEIPTPENTEGAEGVPQNGADMAAAQAGLEGGAMPPTEIPPEAMQAAGGETPSAVPQGEGGAMSPEEEEALRQQMAAAQQPQ